VINTLYYAHRNLNLGVRKTSIKQGLLNIVSFKHKQFIRFYQKLKKKAGEKEPIYFTDSVHPHHQTKLTYGWILKGERKAIATTGRQYHISWAVFA
jgi:hypothetical protein